jgi:hypothetical protein
VRGPSGPQGVSGPQGPSGPVGPGVPAGGLTNQVLVKATNADYSTTWANAGGVGAGLNFRQIVTTNTNVLVAGATSSISLTGYKTYVLYKVATTCPAWVRIYTDSASRTADSTRTIGTDPVPGNGIIAEVITSAGYLTQSITPGTIGFNSDSPVSTNVYLSVTNQDTLTQAIGVSVTLLQLEAT